MGIKHDNRVINNVQVKMNQTIKPIPSLSKSKFITGLQCLKALHYLCYNPKLHDEISEDRKKIFTQGTNIGIYAREVYPGGELINENPRQTSQAIEHTVTAMDKAKPGDAIYEAAFEVDNIVVRADIILKNKDNSWDLIEVKSAKSVKDINIRDVAIQTYVMEKSGCVVNNIHLMHMAPEFQYDAPDWSNISNNFVKADIKQASREFIEQIPQYINEMKEAIFSPAVLPQVEPGEHCEYPYKCSFYNQCHSENN